MKRNVLVVGEWRHSTVVALLEGINAHAHVTEFYCLVKFSAEKNI